MNEKYYYLKWDNKLVPEGYELPLRAVIDKIVKDMPEGKQLAIHFSYLEPNRTDQMNRYLHWMLRYIAKEIGISMITLKDIMKEMFLKDQVTYEGKTFTYIKDTSTLSIPEFEQFIEDIKQYWNDFKGIVVPEKDDKF